MAIDKRNIILVGMPAAGKSTIGVLMAKGMRYNFTDTDITIQVANDATLSELIERDGNDGLLAIEARVLEEIEPVRSVIATGGSAVYSADAMDHLSTTGPVVYLEVSYEALEARVGDLTKRGVIVPPGYSFRDIYEERCALYRRYADITVPTTDLGVEESVALASRMTSAWLADHPLG